MGLARYTPGATHAVESTGTDGKEQSITQVSHRVIESGRPAGSSMTVGHAPARCRQFTNPKGEPVKSGPLKYASRTPFATEIRIDKY